VSHVVGPACVASDADGRPGLRAVLGPVLCPVRLQAEYDRLPGIAEPAPSVTFDLSPIFSSQPSEWIPREDRLTAEALSALQERFRNERLVVLNWHHDALWLVPEQFAPQSDDDWAIPVLPNGDYYIFLTESMDDGFFGHPWEQTLCVFGERLLPSLGSRLASWLTASRQDGEEAKTER
jgi:hypothetical protein